MRWPWQPAPTPAVRETSHVWMLSGGEVRSLGSLSSPTSELLELFTGVTSSGIATGTRAALTCSASYAAIRLISDLCGGLPVHVFKRAENGDRERLRDHPVEGLMNAFANPWTPGPELRREMTGSALLEGRGLAKVIRTRRGEARELHQVSAAVEVDRDTQEPRYKISLANGGTEILRYGDVIDVRALGGEAPAKLAANAIQMALLLQHFGQQFFRNHGRPSGLLVFKNRVDSDTAKEVREKWDDLTGGTLGGGPAVLGHGVSYQPLSFTSTDSQYIENRKHQTLEILRFFGISPTVVGELQDASLNNSESQARQLLTFTLSPWLSRWTEALTRALISPRERADGVYVAFETRALVAADIKATMEDFRQAVGGPWMAPDEARARLDMPGIGATALYPPQGTSAPAAPASTTPA